MRRLRVVRHNADFTIPASYNIQQAGLFRNVGGSGGGGSAVTQTLFGLSDVSISGPTNGQPLVYNGTTLKWENKSSLTASLSGNASTATTAAALSATTWQRIVGNAINYGSYGSIGVTGVTGGYAGISFSDVTGTLMMSTSASGFYYGNSTWRVYWDASGNQINTGNVTAYSSDGRLKKNVLPIPNALSKVNRIAGVTYDWDLEECNKWDFYPTENDVGVIAQDVQAVEPHAVKFAPFDRDPLDQGKSKSGKNYLTVQYEKLVPLLIEAIKELSGKVTTLESHLKSLEDK